MKATFSLFAGTILTALATLLVGCIMPELFQEHELQRESQETDRLLADRHEFDRIFAQILGDVECEAIDLQEAGGRILVASERLFPQYVDLLRLHPGDEWLPAEELVAQNICQRLEDAAAARGTLQR